jgi:hypothetical protein
LLPDEELSLFFERVERFAPIVPDFFVEEVRLEAAAVRVLPVPLDAELLLADDLARVEAEREEVPPVERPPDFAADERELAAFVPDLAAVERPLDLVAADLVPLDLVPVDFAPDDLVPDDLVPDLAPDDLLADERLLEDRELAAFVPEDLVPDFVPALLAPEDLDFVEELFVPLDRELLRAAVPLLFRAVLEDFDEPLRERLPLPLEDELPPELSLWLVLDLSSVGICRLLLRPRVATVTLARQRRYLCPVPSNV